MTETKSRLQLEENEERLKVILPVTRHVGALLFYTVLLVVWTGTIGWVVRKLFSGVDYHWFTYVAMVVWMLVWLWFGNKIVWYKWQYYAANREIIFINKEVLIVRRPLSLLGVTDAYDMAHVQPFRYSEQRQQVAADYGHRTLLFAEDLTVAESQELVTLLNERFFPHYGTEDDDEDEL